MKGTMNKVTAGVTRVQGGKKLQKKMKITKQER
jgi:hypothetical protein